MNLRFVFTLLMAYVLAAAAPVAASADTANVAGSSLWPAVRNPQPLPVAEEKRLAAIVARMTLREKIGQMTQAEIRSVTPEDVERYSLGSVLNGGGAWPAMNRQATVGDWLALAQRFHTASLASSAGIPVLWGTDAVHGHNNVYGATLFPHNIGLGAAHDPVLVEKIGHAVGAAVRATGIRWVFAPTLAVGTNARWGRTYESFAADPALVESYARAYVRGLQGNLRGDGNVLATAKHFIGDGGTFEGVDRGDTRASEAELVARHGRGYVGALEAGVQTVMASYNSWHDTAVEGSAQLPQGKMHGNSYLLTTVLKQRWGFDGFVVSDWNAIEEVPGCRKDSCAAAINAGVDMVMVPEDWRQFIVNTVAQAERGDIPLARIDDAVTRILRVKLRAGVLDNVPNARPEAGRFAGKAAALQSKALARQAVRQSLVLLKNEHKTLPLRRGGRWLVVGKLADSLPAQTGGWSLTWQGSDTTNADFPTGTTVLAALRVAGAREVVYSPDGKTGATGAFDAVIAVIGETPYAETAGDVRVPAPLSLSAVAPQTQELLVNAASHGAPVVSVLLTGRPLETAQAIEGSDAFVVAWLPGTEGGGVADLLVGGEGGRARYRFSGRLPFAWPSCSQPESGCPPQFPLGFGLR
jgi:beta-glucosidase